MAKKLFTLLLCTGLTLGMLTGCGNSDNKESEVEKTSESSKTSDAEEASGEETDDLPSWKQDTTPITIDWFVAYDWYGKTFDPVNNMADKKLLEETGITINFTSGGVDKLGAMVAAGELPDVITYDALSSIRLEMEDAGMLADLESLAEQYAPDLNVPQSQRDWYRNKDGNWYSVVSYYYGPERTNEEFGGYLAFHNMNFVRVDLLEQIGMTKEDLTTLDGLYEAFKAIKEQNIQYDGMDIIPLFGVDPTQWAMQLGAYLEDSEGNYVDVRTTPEYLEALKWLNKLYREGLLTEDVLVPSNEQRDQWISSGRVFFNNFANNTVYTRRTLYSYDQEALLLSCGIVDTLDPEKEHYVHASDTNGWSATMISADSEYADRIITLFSYLSSEEITLDEEYGADCWEIVDGVLRRTEEKQAEYLADYDAYTSKYDMNVNYFEDWTIIQRYENKNPDEIFAKDDMEYTLAYRDNVFDTKCFTNTTPEAGSDEETIQTNVNNFWGQAWRQMVMASGEAECEELYYEAMEEMNAMGFEDLLAYYNKRFQENKEKLGIEYAWPAYQ